MKMQMNAKYILEATEYWFKWLEDWAEKEYQDVIKESMKRSWKNFWLGMSREKAIWWLDQFHAGMFDSYKDRIRDTFWSATYHARVAQKMARIAIDSGQEFVWVGEDDMTYLNRYNMNQKIESERAYRK